MHLCRNGECGDAHVGQIALGVLPEFALSCCAWGIVVNEGPDAYGVQIRPTGPFVNGDTYQLSIASAEEMTLIAVQQTVDYQDVTCNGECATLVLDLAP